VVTIPTHAQGPTSILIALLALICGALVMALAGVLIGNRSTNGTTSPPAATKPSSPPAPTAPLIQPAPEPPRSEPEAATAGQWQACVDYGGNDGPPPQPGQTWWPVVGPGEALEASRLHCRGDAFTNANGNAQVASFRDRDTAAAFAQQLTEDSSHPYSFWVGDPTQR
jgi:hypothetical protein